MARVLVTGTTGLLGGYLVDEARRRGHGLVELRGSRDVDLRDAAAVARAMGDAEIVIHAAAIAAAGDCVRDPEWARAVNVGGTANVVAAAQGRRVVHVSTDLVFDGEGAPYAEDDRPRAVSVYGQTKVLAEQAVEAHRNAVVARVSLLYGPTRTKRVGFFDTQVASIREGRPITLFDDEWRTPLSLVTAAECLFAIAESSFTGRIHVAGPERMSRWEMGMRIAKWLGVAAPAIERASRLAISGEPRPRDVSLSTRALRTHYPTLATRLLEEELARFGGGA